MSYYDPARGRRRERREGELAERRDEREYPFIMEDPGGRRYDQRRQLDSRRRLQDDRLPDFGPPEPPFGRQLLGFGEEELFPPMRSRPDPRQGLPAHERLSREIDAGFNGSAIPRPLGLNILDRDFDLFGPVEEEPEQEFGNDPLLFGDMILGTIEQGRGRPEAFYGQELNMSGRPRSPSITSGYRLPPHATADPRMPRPIKTGNRRMNNPQADMLLDARPLPGNMRGTPMPGMEQEEDLSEFRSVPPERRRRRRWDRDEKQGRMAYRRFGVWMEQKLMT